MPTVSQVLAWRPEAVTQAAEAVAHAQRELDTRVGVLANATDRMNWRGRAADGARHRVELEKTYTRGVGAALESLDSCLRKRANQLARARTAVQRARDSAMADRFEVHEDGTVNGDGRWAQLAAAGAGVGDATWARMQLSLHTDQHTLVTALAAAEKAADALAADVRVVSNHPGLTTPAPPAPGSAPAPAVTMAGTVAAAAPSPVGVATGIGFGGCSYDAGGSARYGGSFAGYHAGGLGSGEEPPGALPTGRRAEWIAQALDILREMGYDTSHISPADIEAIIKHESGGNPYAINLSDSNALAGHPSKGLMQCIDSTFHAHMAPGHADIWNPVDNIVAGVRYAISRYGSVDNVPGVVALHHGSGYVGY